MAKKGMMGRFTSAMPAPTSTGFAWRMEKLSSRFNVWAYRTTNGRVGGRMDRAPVIVLHTKGAKSGEPREAPLIGLADGDGIVLVASHGGSVKSPAWYHNLRAHPDVVIENKGERTPMTATLVEGAERERLWPELTEIWPAYEDYQARATRQIPVVRCDPS